MSEGGRGVLRDRVSLSYTHTHTYTHRLHLLDLPEYGRLSDTQACTIVYVARWRPTERDGIGCLQPRARVRERERGG